GWREDVDAVPTAGRQAHGVAAAEREPAAGGVFTGPETARGGRRQGGGPRLRHGARHDASGDPDRLPGRRRPDVFARRQGTGPCPRNTPRSRQAAPRWATLSGVAQTSRSAPPRAADP